jgi:hypothetical protein
MGRRALEVADIFRSHGPAWRDTQHDHLSLGQLKVMSAIEQCRTETLDGMCCTAQPVSMTKSPTTPAVTGIARSVRPVPLSAGSKPGRPIFYRWRITMWCSPCLRRSAPLPITIKLSSMVCLKLPPRRYARLPSIPSIWGTDRGHSGSAYTGLSADPSSTCARHRSWRRFILGW